MLADPDRLKQLRGTALLDAPTEEAFDRLTRLASKLLQAPLAQPGPHRHARVAAVVASGGPEMMTDPNRLLQLLSNLVGNAVKFTPSGGAVRIAAQPASGEIRFSVSDWGAGIPEPDLEHIFERFWQGERESHQGAGLGLAICKGIVEGHGGRIRVESRVGEGITFRFTVPTIAEG